MFTKILDILKRFGVYLAIAASGIAIYGYFEAKLIQNNPQITITKNSIEHLTILPKADGLKAQFIFKDSVVKDLWKIRITLENTGNSSIVGKGYQKNIINNNLSILVTKGYSFIDVNKIKENFPINLESSSQDIRLTFDQWRPNEFIVFEIYVDGSVYQGRSIPSVILDDRELINGKSIYKEINTTPVEKKYLKDLLPNFLSSIIYWFYVLTSAIFFIAMPFAIIDEYKKRSRYKLWMLVWKSDYDKEIIELVKNGVLDKYYEPLDLSDDNWLFFATPKIFVKAKPNVSSVALGGVVVSIFLLIPLLWIIRIQ